MSQFQVVYPPQLPLLSDPQGNDYIIGYSPTTGKMVRISISSLLSGRNVPLWQADETYVIDDLVEWNLRFWKNLQVANIGNIPSENTFWTEVSGDETIITTTPDNLSKTLQKTAHAFIVGNVLTIDGSGALVKISNTLTQDVVGVVKAVVDVNNFTVLLSGFIDGLSGLTPGEKYYATNTGTLSATISEKPVLIAASASSGYLLASSGGGGGGGSGDMVLANTQTVNGAKTFLNNTFILRNVADTYNILFSNQATVNRVITIPDITDTLVTLTASQSLTNKKLGSLNTNGFVKTSGSDGTLLVDTTTYLPIGGGVLTNYLNLHADPTSALHAVTKQYADSLVVGLWDDRGNYNASSNAYPSSGGSGSGGSILKGDIWTISVAGTLPTGQLVEAGDTVRALVDSPGSTQANWAIAQNNIGYTPITNALNSSQIIVGNSSNLAAAVAMTGDISINNVGLTSYTGILPYSKFSNGTGLSIVGRSANTSGVQADIVAGTDAHVLRRSGTTLGFGTIGDASISDLAYSKLTGTVPFYSLASGGTATGVNTFTCNAQNQMLWRGIWTSSLTGSYHHDFGGTFTNTATASDVISGYRFSPTLISNGTSQVQVAVDIAPSFSGGTTPFNLALRVQNGNVLIGPTTITANTRLDIIGVGTTTSNALRIADSGNIGRLTVFDNGQITITRSAAGGALALIIGATGISGTVSMQMISNGVGELNFNQTGRIVFNQTTSVAVPGVRITNSSTFSHLASLATDLNVGSTFAPTSGTGNYTNVSITPTINQTGAASGEVLGIDYNPTLTNVLGNHLAFRATSGNVLIGATSITVNTKLDVRGAGTTTAMTQRWANSANTLKFAFVDNGDLQVDKTMTASGTTGAQNINKISGSVNFAAASSSLVVTNSLVTTSSNVQVQVCGTDATAKTATVTLANGSFTITLNASATAETKVVFLITN
jgi:hypothetical protein